MLNDATRTPRTLPSESPRPSSRAEDPALPALTVLLVDDHETFRRVARAELEDGGFEVIAELAEAAPVVPTAAELRPDVVLLDIRLPDGDGVHVAADLAAAVPESVVVLISSVRATDARERLDAAQSAALFLPKSTLSGPTLRSLLAS